MLDLLGILLLGVVTALAVAVAGDTSPPQQVQSLISFLGIEDLPLAQVTIWLTLIAAGLLITKSLLNLFLTRMILRFLATRQAEVSRRLTANMFSQSLFEVTRQSSQDVSWALTNGVNYATLIILSQVAILVAEVSLLLVLTVGLLFIDPILTIASIAFFLLIAVVLQKVLSGWASAAGAKSQQAEVSSLAAIQEGLHSYREIVVLGRRKFYVDRIAGLRLSYANAQSDGLFVGVIPKYVLEVALIAGAGLLALSQMRSEDLAASVATIAVFLAAGSRIVPSILRLQTATIVIRSGAAQARPTFELAEHLRGLDSERRDNEAFQVSGYSSSEGPLREASDGIHVQQLTITYPGASRPALDNVSFSLDGGNSLAIVGPTGSGKSTLADALLGLLEPELGYVRLGGKPTKVRIAESPGVVAYVPQVVAMANATLRENIALAIDPSEVEEDRVWRALTRAQLLDVVSGLPNGLDTPIGERGFRLSGGQRQRLGLARALYSEPRLLVLDEATSALDADTEDAISRSLMDLEGAVTTVIIAHRLATVRHCDVVIYLDEGALLGVGTFEEVRNQVPQFDRQASLLGL
jgi:ABC-type multidrug transport system fused ATPase/permease subunit